LGRHPHALTAARLPDDHRRPAATRHRPAWRPTSPDYDQRHDSESSAVHRGNRHSSGGSEVLAYKRTTALPAVTARCSATPSTARALAAVFEIGPGGHTTLERHAHTHVVIPIRGAAARWSWTGHPLALHDWCRAHWGWTVPGGADDPFGFLCAVTVDRDRSGDPPATTWRSCARTRGSRSLRV